MKEIFQTFFKLGCLAFGGPAAHIAMMEAEVVSKRKWMTSEEFLDMVGTTNLIPGPNSTEMTMHCGYHRGGKLGLFVAGLSFIFPATILTGILAWLYFEYGELPSVQPFVKGIQPAVLALIAAAVLKLGKKALKSTELWILGVLVVAASLYGINEISLLFIGGFIGAIYFYTKNRQSNTLKMSAWPLLIPQAVLVGKSTVFLSFLKIGAILYGSGYVLFAYLDAELVETGLLSRQVLLDAIAAGQFTPGPVLSTSTFIGYQLGGPMTAILATVGIFLPSFLFILILHPFLHKMRQSKFLSGFLDSVNVVSVAIMAAVLLIMAEASVTDWKSGLLALLSGILVFGFKKINVMWIILGSAVLGWALQFVG